MRVGRSHVSASKRFKINSMSWKTGTCPLSFKAGPRSPERLSMAARHQVLTTHSSRTSPRTIKKMSFQRLRANLSRMESRSKNSSQLSSRRKGKSLARPLKKTSAVSWRSARTSTRSTSTRVRTHRSITRRCPCSQALVTCPMPTSSRSTLTVWAVPTSTKAR